MGRLVGLVAALEDEEEEEEAEALLNSPAAILDAVAEVAVARRTRRLEWRTPVARAHCRHMRSEKALRKKPAVSRLFSFFT